MATPGGKAIVLGLDGAPYSLLKRFGDEGVMPNLARIFAAGTARADGHRHPRDLGDGLDQLHDRDEPRQARRLRVHGPRSEDVPPAVHELQLRQGLDHLGLPEPPGAALTRPEHPDHLSRARPRRRADLRLRGHRPEARHLPPEPRAVPARRSATSSTSTPRPTTTASGAFVDELWDALAKREEALWHLLVEEPWSLYIGVVTETDRLHHYLWAAIEDEAHPQHSFFKDYYRKVDTIPGTGLGPLRERCALHDHVRPRLLRHPEGGLPQPLAAAGRLSVVLFGRRPSTRT